MSHRRKNKHKSRHRAHEVKNVMRSTLETADKAVAATEPAATAEKAASPSANAPTETA